MDRWIVRVVVCQLAVNSACSQAPAGGHFGSADAIGGGGDGSLGAPIGGVPQGVNTFLDPSDIAAIKAAGMPIYPGSTPPQVAGQYQTDDLAIAFDDDGASGGIGTYIVTLAGQTLTGEITVGAASATDSRSGAGVISYISGANGYFTIYVNAKGKTADCAYAWPWLISGRFTAAGIADWTEAYIMKTKTGTCAKVMSLGDRRILVETDALAERVSGAAAGCNGQPCSGCCDAGVCSSGTTSAACGAKGVECQVCGAGQVCSAGACAVNGKKQPGESCGAATDCDKSACLTGAHCVNDAALGTVCACDCTWGSDCKSGCCWPLADNSASTCTAESRCQKPDGPCDYQHECGSKGCAAIGTKKAYCVDNTCNCGCTSASDCATACCVGVQSGGYSVCHAKTYCP